MNLLDDSDPTDPHRGQVPVRTTADLEAAFRRLYSDDDDDQLGPGEVP